MVSVNMCFQFVPTLMRNKSILPLSDGYVHACWQFGERNPRRGSALCELACREQRAREQPTVLSVYVFPVVRECFRGVKCE